MEVHYLNISESLSLLEMQEKRYESSINGDPLKDHILSLKLGLPFLRTFLRFSDSRTLKLRIKDMVYNLWWELHSVSRGPKDASHIWYWDSVYSSLRGKMKNVIVKPETREYDDIFLEFFDNKRYFKEINDFLLERLGDLLSGKVDLIPLAKEIEDLREKLRLLKALFTYLANKQIHVAEENKELLSPLVALLEKSARLMFLCLVDEMDEEMGFAMKRKLSYLKEEINANEIYMLVLRASMLSESRHNHLESEFYLLDNQIRLLDCNIHLNDPSLKLYDELKMLQTFLGDLAHEQKIKKFSYLVTSIEAITCKAIPILYSCCYRNMKEDMARKVLGALTEVLDQIKHIQAEVKETESYIYPETDGLGFLDHFPQHLEQQQESQLELTEILKNQIETLHGDFAYLRSSFLKIMKQQHNEYEELGDLWTRIIGLEYQAEHAINFHLVQNAPLSLVMSSLSQITEQVKLIRSTVTLFYDGEKKTSGHVTSQTIDAAPNRVVPFENDVVLGFEAEATMVEHHLVGDTRELNVVSIVGMSGLGKTTLAMKIFCSPSIIDYFEVRAWCSISQMYQKRELLLTILSALVHDNIEIRLSDEQLREMIYKHLKGHRYLIVLDDIWDVSAWHDLARCFPDDGNHSRILITTRLQELALRIKVDSKVHSLRFLSVDQSWELLQKKLFQHESCPAELLEVGRRIVEHCEGIPRAIVLIAGCLAKVEKRADKWTEILRMLSSITISELGDGGGTIVDLSYQDLPYHLKMCFLYIRAFVEEDEQIPVSTLKWLWIAEEFIKKNGVKSLEDVAEEYLMDLINRGLVIAAEERSLGGVKACRVHDLAREFLLEKAKKESLLQVMQADPLSKFLKVYDQRQLSICFKRDDLMEPKPFGSSIHSLLHTATAYPYYVIEFSFQNFKRLRVLHLGCINIKSFSEIVSLINLRLLAVGARITSIPSSIANLWNLQCLLVEANGLDSDNNVDVPDSIWLMVNLKHVHINPGACFKVHNRIIDSPLCETLSMPFFSSKEDAEKLLRMLPNLRKLKFIFPSRCPFPTLDFLRQLVSLKVIFHKPQYGPHDSHFNVPVQLRKLTLFNSALSLDGISRIGRTVPNLEVLKLIGLDSGETLDMDDGAFPRLKYLKLRRVRIVEWINYSDYFPPLEQLVLEDCRYLKEIPRVLGDIPTLRMIKVSNCNPSLHTSVRRIEEEQRDLGNKDLIVCIYPKERQYSDDFQQEDFREEQEEQ